LYAGKARSFLALTLQNKQRPVDSEVNFSSLDATAEESGHPDKKNRKGDGEHISNQKSFPKAGCRAVL